MPKEAPPASSDMVLNAASFVLAFFSASFAGYMVMYGPIDGNGNAPRVTVASEPFNAVSSKLGSYDSLDPIVTGSIAKSSQDDLVKEAKYREIELSLKDQHLSYSLRSVFMDTGFVDISNGKSVVTLPVEKGGRLPGIGEVLGFEKRQGRWILVTGAAEISQEGLISLR
jgi:hypothetical protein